jgi:5-methylcytosine-specific restriction endonuclease McrA
VAFPESVELEARQRARGICQCERRTCPHFGRCRVRGAEFHHKRSLTSGGTDELSNCELLCSPCHQRSHAEGDLGLL